MQDTFTFLFLWQAVIQSVQLPPCRIFFLKKLNNSSLSPKRCSALSLLQVIIQLVQFPPMSWKHMRTSYSLPPKRRVIPSPLIPLQETVILARHFSSTFCVCGGNAFLGSYTCWIAACLQNQGNSVSLGVCLTDAIPSPSLFLPNPL